jgi:hypothetical protein
MVTELSSVSLIQEGLILAVLLSLPLIAYTLNRGITRHLDLISKRLNAIQRIRLLELARELLTFFGTSKASDSVMKMISDIENNGNDADVGLAAAEAIPDIEHLNRSLSEVLDPTINMSKIRAVTKYLLLLVLADGVILCSIIFLIFIMNQSLVIDYMYTILEYVDLGWAIVFSLVFLFISLQITNLEKDKLSLLLSADQ